MTQMKRLPDWKSRLTAYLAAIGTRPFKPGQHDCALFVAGAVETMTGDDPARGWRGYRSLAEGRRALARRGYADQVALVASLLPEIAPALARAGDVAVVAGEDGPAVGIVQGEMVFALRREGLAILPRLQIERAFRL